MIAVPLTRALWEGKSPTRPCRLTFALPQGVLDGAAEALTPIADRLATCTKIGPDWV